MAKKGQAIQLQTEVNTDEEWEKLLQKDGLIVVDIYSEWCGPCSGMAANLKKLKLEIGGDLLQLAIAKSDKITALERFKNKSEPTWMFIVNGKMVNFMFGANAPKLTRLIIDELKKETDAREGRRERVEMEISDLTPEEQERIDAAEGIAKAAREKEERKRAEELFNRRTAECRHILEALEHLSVILIFPHAKNKYKEAFGDLLGEAGLTISQTEKVKISEELLNELFYFSENPFPEEAIEELTHRKSIALLIKPIPARDVTEPTNSLIQEVIYGRTREPPGLPDSPAKFLAQVPHEPAPATDEEEELKEPAEEVTEMIGVWVPESDLIRATAMRLFFPKATEHYLIAEPEPTPPHYAVVFDAYRRHEIAETMDKYPQQILRYGFFTNAVPEEAQVIAKSIRKYERCTDRQPGEKMVIQLSKKKSECVLAFAQLKPFYISPNVMEGKRECQLFFPDDYDEEEEEEEEETEETEKESIAASESKEAGVADHESNVKEEVEGGEEVATLEGTDEEPRETGESGEPAAGEYPEEHPEMPPEEVDEPNPS